MKSPWLLIRSDKGSKMYNTPPCSPLLQKAWCILGYHTKTALKTCGYEFSWVKTIEHFNKNLEHTRSYSTWNWILWCLDLYKGAGDNFSSLPNSPNPHLRITGYSRTRSNAEQEAAAAAGGMVRIGALFLIQEHTPADSNLCLATHIFPLLQYYFPIQRSKREQDTVFCVVKGKGMNGWNNVYCLPLYPNYLYHSSCILVYRKAPITSGS